MPVDRAGVTNSKTTLAQWRGTGDFSRTLSQETSIKLLHRTAPAHRANGERKLAHDLFMQATWALLGVAALAQLLLLVWLDLMF